MASSRMKNRIYWAYVKAEAYHPDRPVTRTLKSLFNRAFYLRWTDRALLAFSDENLTGGVALQIIEDEHGPARLKDVHNRDLWPVRERLFLSEREREGTHLENAS